MTCIFGKEIVDPCPVVKNYGAVDLDVLVKYCQLCPYLKIYTPKLAKEEPIIRH